MTASIYIVSDQKLTTRGAHGAGVADNMIANVPVKNTKHPVCLKAAGLFQHLQTFECLALRFVRQMAESQPHKSLAKSASNVSAGVHLRNSPVKVKDTHLMNNNQPVADILNFGSAAGMIFCKQTTCSACSQGRSP